VPNTADEPLPPRARPSRRLAQRPAPAGLTSHFDRVTRLVEDGRITFVLGSAVHDPTKLMAQEFYEELARVFECEALKEERFAVAQYIADRYGRENLYAEIRKLFVRNPLRARATHQMFAAWRSFRRSSGDPVPFPTIVTTNYDDILETTLAHAGLPYHLFSYQADGPQRGRFYHRAPDNSLRIIERPRNIRRLADGFVIVKFNGGVNRHAGIRESYSTTRLDYWDLAGRIPDVLPAAVQHTLSENPMLFLGHGLRAADVESLIRFAHKEHPGPRSWAVLLHRNQDSSVWQPVVKGEGDEYWQQLGINIVNQPVGLYVNEIRSRLERRR